LPGYGPVAAYGERKTNPAGVAATVAFHLLLVLAYLFRPDDPDRARKAAESDLIVMVAPPGKPKAEQSPQRPKEFKQELPRVDIPRLPDTITLPEEKPAETARETRQPPPDMDMAAMVEARRKARGATAPAAPEGDNEKAMRNINANIARASGNAIEGNNTGGIFDITDKTFHSAQLKFRGWNPNFKRRWLQQVTVEQGNAPDLETAIVNKMIEIIRKEKPGDFEWESHRLDRVVTMSARKEHTAELQAFLFREMFCPKSGPSTDARCRAQSR
jgi:hypothetical protein